MYDKLAFFLLTACLLGTAQCQSPSEAVDAALDKAKQIIPQLNGLNLNISALPISQAEDALREKCEKSGGSYDDVKNAGATLISCTKDHLPQFNKLQEEIEASRPTGALDEVFKKYCLKKPMIQKCLSNFTNTVETCLDPVEKDSKKILDHIFEKVLDFVCHKDGDRIALFVASRGPECFKDKAMDLKDCGNQTFGSYAKDVPLNLSEGLAGAAQSAANLLDPKNLPVLTFDIKSCRNIQTFQTCAVEKLEACTDATPANLVDSIFNYVKKVSPCKDLLKKHGP